MSRRSGIAPELISTDERMTVGSDGTAVDLRAEGLGSVVKEMVTPRREMAA